MKNKWILNFLLIALSVNAVSPLLAMEDNIDLLLQLKNSKDNSVAPQKPTSNIALPPRAGGVANSSQTTNVTNPSLVTGEQKPLPIDEDVTGLLPAIKNCWNGLVNSASNRFNSITESASKNNVLAMLGRGAKEVGNGFSWLGSGLASVVGKIPSLYFEKPETLEGFSKGRAALTAALGISAYLTGKHYWTLYRIGRKITKSKNAEAEGKRFLFGSWKCETYETCRDLSDNAETVKRELLAEARQDSSRIHILDKAKKQRIIPGKVTEEDIQNALYDEQKMLHIRLTETISCFTDASQKILELVCGEEDNKKNKKIDPDLWYPDAAFDERCFNYLANLYAHDFNEFGELITEKCNFGIKRLLFTPPGGWKFYPQYWRLFPCYNKATEVFWTVYTCYLRTRTLLKIISETPQISASEQSGLQELLKQVNTLIDKQDTAFNNDKLKRLQTTRFQLAIDMVDNLINKQGNRQQNDTFTYKLTEIKEHLEEVCSSLFDPKTMPKNNVLLTCAKDKLMLLIKAENN